MSKRLSYNTDASQRLLEGAAGVRARRGVYGDTERLACAAYLLGLVAGFVPAQAVPTVLEALDHEAARIVRCREMGVDHV